MCKVNFYIQFVVVHYIHMSTLLLIANAMFIEQQVILGHLDTVLYRRQIQCQDALVICNVTSLKKFQTHRIQHIIYRIVFVYIQEAPSIKIDYILNLELYTRCAQVIDKIFEFVLFKTKKKLKVIVEEMILMLMELK